MNWIINILREVGEALFLMVQSIAELRSIWPNRHKIVTQVIEIGNASLPMVVVLSVFMGGVLSLQTGHALASTGLQSRLGVIVGLSMARELAPVMISILIARRVGSAIAAGVGSMSVYPENEALG